MNNADKARYMQLAEIGCIICKEFEDTWSPSEIHHLVTFPKKDNQRTIPLCFVHHREGSNKPEYVSRHPHMAAWESRYGSEEELLEITNKLIE